MKTSTVLAAISALDSCRKILRGDTASIPEQMALANQCSLSAARLREELLHEHPTVQVYRDEPFLLDLDPRV